MTDTPEVGGRVIVYKDFHGKWRWTRRAANDRVVGDSGEGYENKAHAFRMANGLFPDTPIQIESDDDEVTADA